MYEYDETGGNWQELRNKKGNKKKKRTGLGPLEAQVQAVARANEQGGKKAKARISKMLRHNTAI